MFLTFHLLTLCQTLRTGLGEEYDWPSDDIEEFIEDLTGQSVVLEALRDYELTPPSINTDGARRIMRRLCEGDDFTLDDTHGYLATRRMARRW